jgi:hypothetical protein
MSETRNSHKLIPGPGVSDQGIVDIVHAAVLGGKLPKDYDKLILSFFSDAALAFGKEHLAGIKDKDLALQQAEVSLSDQQRHDELVLHHTVLLGRLVKAVKVTPEKAGSAGGAAKGTGGGLTMKQSKKALAESLGKTYRELSHAEKIAENPKAVSRVIAEARDGGARATIRQAMREIERKPASEGTPKAKTPATNSSNLVKALQAACSYLAPIVPEWDKLSEEQQQAITKEMHILLGYWQGIAKRYGVREPKTA